MTVTIIIPVYQVSDYVERCMRSVMNQTYNNIECIIVDDATRDDSIEKCEKLINNVNDNETLRYENENGNGIKFKILHHDTNQGLSAARNTGIKAATGEYLYFLDSDDEITPDCIENLVAIAEKAPEAEMVIGNFEYVPQNLQNEVKLDLALPTKLDQHQAIADAFLGHRIPVFAWNKLIKRSFIIEHSLFFKVGIIHEDFLWSFFVTKYLNSIRIHQGITYHYYKRIGSIVNSSQFVIVGNSYYSIYEDIVHHLTKGREVQELNCYIEGFCRYYLKYKAEIPEYKTLYAAYLQKAKEHGCRTVILKLRLSYIMGMVPFGLTFLEVLREIRKKIA